MATERPGPAKKDHLPPKKTTQHLFVYFMSYEWRHGRESGFSSFEQPIITKIKYIQQVLSIQALYAKALEESKMEAYRKMPFWKRPRDWKMPVQISILSFQLIREEDRVITPEESAEMAAREEARIKVTEEIQNAKQEGGKHVHEE